MLCCAACCPIVLCVFRRVGDQGSALDLPRANAALGTGECASRDYLSACTFWGAKFGRAPLAPAPWIPANMRTAI